MPATPVEVVRWVESEPPPSDDEDFGPAARHARATLSRWQRTVDGGEHALGSAAEEIAAQVDAVAERMAAAMEQRQADRAAYRAGHQLPDPAWDVTEVQVTFGVQLKGEATVAVFSASTETSAQVTLKLTRS